MGGRPTVVTDRKLAAALAMREQAELTMSQIAEGLGVSPASLYRHLARHRYKTEVRKAAAAWRHQLSGAVATGNLSRAVRLVRGSR